MGFLLRKHDRPFFIYLFIYYLFLKRSGCGKMTFLINANEICFPRKFDVAEPISSWCFNIKIDLSDWSILMSMFKWFFFEVTTISFIYQIWSDGQILPFFLLESKKENISSLWYVRFCQYQTDFFEINMTCWLIIMWCQDRGYGSVETSIYLFKKRFFMDRKRLILAKENCTSILLMVMMSHCQLYRKKGGGSRGKGPRYTV